MKANFIQIKPWDESISRTVIIDLYNQMMHYLNPKEPIEMTEDILNFYLGENTILARDFLRFEDNKGNIIAYAGVVKSPVLKDTWTVGYGILLDYFKSELPGKLIDAIYNLGKELSVPELLFNIYGSLAAPLDKILGNMGFKPIQYRWAMILDDFSLFNPPSIPQGIVVLKEKEINDYSSYITVLNEAFQGSFKYEPTNEKEIKQIIDLMRNTTDIEHCFAFENDNLVGTCNLIINPKQPTVGKIVNFAILPSYQHRGIGSAIFAFGIEALRDKGCKELSLTVGANNEKALDLYKKFGFNTQENLTQKFYQII